MAQTKPPRSTVARTVQTHLLLLIALAVALIAGGVAAGAMRLTAAVLVGWDVGVACYLAMVLYRITGATSASIRQRADEIDETKWVVLIVTVGAAIVSLVAIGVEL